MITTKIEQNIDSLAKWRSEVISEVFGKEPNETLLNANRAYYMKHVPNGSHSAIVGYHDENPAGCGGICIYDELPSPDNPSGRCAYLMNIYVKKAFRHMGIGKAIVLRLIDEARHKGCGKIYLETTSAGYPLYRSVGFNKMTELMKL